MLKSFLAWLRGPFGYADTFAAARNALRKTQEGGSTWAAP